MTRKYPSKQKTTTPNGYREYKKLQMREYRNRKKEATKKFHLTRISDLSFTLSKLHRTLWYDTLTKLNNGSKIVTIKVEVT